jgi:hypothetical protein
MATKPPIKTAKKVEVVSLPVRDMAEEKKWRAESDLRILKEARDIESNKSRMAAAKRIADEQMKALAKIKQMRK